jgi:hypothetical protein
MRRGPLQICMRGLSQQGEIPVSLGMMTTAEEHTCMLPRASTDSATLSLSDCALLRCTSVVSPGLTPVADPALAYCIARFGLAPKSMVALVTGRIGERCHRVASERLEGSRHDGAGCLAVRQAALVRALERRSPRAWAQPDGQPSRLPRCSCPRPWESTPRAVGRALPWLC